MGTFSFSPRSLSFYGGDRLVYLDKIPFLEGYDAGNEAGISGHALDRESIYELISFKPLKETLFNFFYFFFGRFTRNNLVLSVYPLTYFNDIYLCRFQKFGIIISKN